MCWGHWMPLTGYTLYAAGEQVHAAVWPSATETFLLSCRNMAFEGRLYVVAAASYLTKSMLPPGFPLQPELEPFPEELCVGGSAIVGPDGRFLAGPVYGCETIVYADIDLDRLVGEKQSLDVAGHYSRPDIFTLHVNRRRMEPLAPDDADALQPM